MKTKIMFGVALMVCVLIITAVTLASSLSRVPKDHDVIAHNFKVIYTKSGVALEMKLVDFSDVTRGAGQPLAIFLSTGKTYKHSTWLFQMKGDTEMTLSLWGPGDDGHSYEAEFGRTSGHAFTIKYNGETVLEIDEITDWSTHKLEGYYWVQLQYYGEPVPIK